MQCKNWKKLHKKSKCLYSSPMRPTIKMKQDQTRSIKNYVDKQMERPAQNFLSIAQSQNQKKKPLFSHKKFALFLSNFFKVRVPETEVLYNIHVKWIEFFCSHMIVQNYNIYIKKSTLSIKVACKLKCVVLSYHIYK